MDFRITAPLIGALFVGSLLLNACAPAAANKSDMSSSEMSSSATGESVEGKKTVADGGDVYASSSLDALRRGETPGTGPLKNIYFDFDSYGLRPEARETLKVNANWLKANPSVQIEIEGHCDERGTNEYNLALGAKRAQAAKDYLVTLGISADRFKTVSYGEEIPVCNETTEECWQKKRHARFAILPNVPVS